MSKIKIKSNPYEKQITYWKKGSDDVEWRQITYNDEFKSSNLIKDYFRENYFLDVMNEAFNVLVDEFGDRKNKLEIQFDGVDEEFDSACNEVKSKYSNSIEFLRGEYFLKSVDIVLKFEKEIFNEIKKSIPENYITVENSITEILKNQKKESANKYQVAMDIKSSLEKLNNDVEKNIEDEIDRRQNKQKEIEKNVLWMEKCREKANDIFNKKITEHNIFFDGLKKKDVIDFENLSKCFFEMKSKLQKDGKNADEIDKELEKWTNEEISKRIQAFLDEINQQLHKYVQSVGEEVNTIVKNNEKDITGEIIEVENLCDEMQKKFDKFKVKEGSCFITKLFLALGGGGIVTRFGWFMLLPLSIVALISSAIFELSNKHEVTDTLKKINNNLASEFSKWYGKNIYENVEKYFADNQKKIEKYFSTELQKLEKTKNELGGEIEQLNGYLEILDCCNKEINGLFQWENSK